MAETERKSKRKAPPKIDEDAEPKGVKKTLSNPIVILLLVILATIGAVALIFLISQWLSGA